MFTFFLYETGSPAEFISVKFIFFFLLNFEFLQVLFTYDQDSNTIQNTRSTWCKRTILQKFYN